jgi:hypothetical protein
MSNIKTFCTYLTTEEILLLDDKCRPEIQEKVNEAKQNLSFNTGNELINSVIGYAVRDGEFRVNRASIGSCSYCGKERRYAKYSRDSRARYGHRKGETNYDKPIYYGGYQFGGVTIQGGAGMCNECNETHQYIEFIKQYIINNNLPVQLRENTKYKKDLEKICFRCRTIIYESEMSKRPTMMGDGSYPAGCPHCKSESNFFGPSHKLTGKWRMVEVKNVDSN